MPKILVIDDEESIVKLIEIALRKVGHKVKTAIDSAEGISMFAKGTFDLVITDIRMPGMDGNIVAKHIRNSTSSYTPIIGISGTPWLLEADCFDAFLVKPFLIRDLYNKINDLTSVPQKMSAIK